ncbi:M14 family metallocarboxypeptidase [Bacillus inaquosorum]|uniref:M14 family metallopeptidase n=1 Tax=Bacillus TaxID=1386 RepID=UPI001CDD4A7A|nr:MULTISPECIES: M14 family metallocarboxypeptidase [Bacillus]MCY7764688.1 M14 family metallocarboxypeptidase [Bacillus inaquosorum]MCY7899167.1 M14 family metallocarboxypeptidase [Bacillus inaquosorum]MCY7978593.1 M14 family metallocarboxypeptidase [Bacillus inaquosorum]MCY8031201.1 M14 family metallocarboxypeptidase [Bacillus inaquosorum]MCY8261036.1 M14 family metallocarboxypeptidase [Bacillus inaquosorum]
MMAFITVKPEIKHNLARVARELKIDEELLRSANRSAQKHQLFCPGYVIEEHNDKELQTIQDIKSFLQPRRLDLSDNWVEQEKVYDFSAVEKEVKKIIDVFPFVSCREIGRSVLGRPIWELKAGGEHTSKKVHMNASFHANEWITTSVLLKWFKEYCMSLCCNSPFFGFSPMKLFSSTSLSLVPLVNPDGVDLVLNGSEGMGDRKEELERLNDHRPNFNEWKANINGVDLNKQFPSLWEIEKYRKPAAPSYRDFPGISPLTEPESIAMYRLITVNPPDRLLALHTQGEEIYWGYKGLEPEESAAVIKDFEKLSGNIYKGVRDIDSYAGFRDWFIHHYFKEGYTVELGKGQNPLPFKQFTHIYNATNGILWRALFFHE